MKLIANCSPIIFLAKLNSLELLAKDEIHIPLEVKNELLKKDSVEKDKISRFFSEKNVSIVNVQKTRNFSLILGKGEMSVINLALEKKVVDVLIDERRGRSLARVHKLKPHGTLWIILRAYKNKVINKQQARELIYELPSTGFRANQELLFQTLKKLD